MARVRRVPQRMCVGCRQMRPKREMVRVVRSPAGEVRVDLTGKAAGRGAYVDRDPACLETAMRERRLAHALEIDIPAALTEELREALARPATPPPPKVIRLKMSETQRMGR